MSTNPGGRLRAALVTIAALGLAFGAASPALADSGTPLTPTNLVNGTAACSTDQTAPLYWDGNASLTIEGVPADSDPSERILDETFQLYPVDDPTHVTTWALDATAGLEEELQIPSSDLADGETYVWQAQTVADGTTSAWTSPCYVTIDSTAPSAAPTVTSSNYPAGETDQPGAPVEFTFGANGVSDVIGYEFSWGEQPPIADVGPLSDPYVGWAGAVQAPVLGGPVTVDLIPPTAGGPSELFVTSVDRAYNSSPVTTYMFFLKSGQPTVSVLKGLPHYGSPTAFKIVPNSALEAQSPVTSYNVQIVGDPAGQKNYSIPAAADGTAVTQVTLDNTYEGIQVSSVSADGWTSDPGNYVFNSEPTVSSHVYPENGTGGGAGVTGEFAFSPPVVGVVSYTYSFDDGTTETTVKAHHDKATVGWTPGASGDYDVEVYATLSDGTQLYPYDYYFSVS